MRGIFSILASFLLVSGLLILPGKEVPAQPLVPAPAPALAPRTNPEEEVQIQAVFDQARAAAERGEVDAAITTLQDLINRAPEGPAISEAYLRLGDLFSGKGKYPEAVEAFRTLLEKYPGSSWAPLARYNLALAYLGAHDPGSAVALFDAVQGEQERKLDIYQKSAEIYFRQGDFLPGVVLLERELPLLQAAEADSMRALATRTIHDRLKEKELQELVRRFPHAFPGDEAQIRLIELFFSQEDDPKVEHEIKRFAAQFPGHPYLQRAGSLLAQIKARLKSNRILLSALLPLSGRFSYFGTSALNGVRLAIQGYKEGGGGQSLGLVVKDIDEDRGRLKQTTEELLSEYHPAAIIGPLLSRDVEQVAGVAEKSAIPLITPGAASAHLNRGWKFIFRNGLTGGRQSVSMANYAVTTLAQRRFVVLYPRDPFGEELMRSFSGEVSRLGGELIDAESYLPEETDFGTPIRKLKEADLKKYGHLEPIDNPDDSKRRREFAYFPGFDSLYLIGDSAQVGLILPQLAFYDIHNVVFLGNSGWDSEQLLGLAGKFAEGGVFVDGFFVESPDPPVHDFVSLYRRQYHEEPNLFAAQAYDAANIILNAIRKGATEPAKIREALLSTRDFPGASGLTTILPDGEAEKKPFLIQVKNGRFVQIN